LRRRISPKKDQKGRPVTGPRVSAGFRFGYLPPLVAVKPGARTAAFNKPLRENALPRNGAHEKSVAGWRRAGSRLASQTRDGGQATAFWLGGYFRFFLRAA
jgi:hypothetical protein